MSCNNQRNEPCLLPWNHVYYHTDKKVYPCCKLVSHPHFELGGNEEPFDQIWNSDRLRTLRLQIMNDSVPRECLDYCYNGITPLHVHVPQEIKQLTETFFANTAQDGSYKENFVLWNVNESNVCNFACVYCCSEFSNRFDGKTKKTFDTVEELMALFKQHAPNLKAVFLSAGESHLQPGYYQMLEHLVEIGMTNIQLGVHTNFSGYKFGKKNFFELINHFPNATVFASLDSYGERAEFIRQGTVWKDIEEHRKILKEYTNIKFAAQPVVTNLNIWSLPDFHRDWYERGLLRKDNIRFFTLSTPAELHVTVLNQKMKECIKEKYESYLEFLRDEKDTLLNQKTPYEKVKEFLALMECPPIVDIGRFDYFILKQSLKTKVAFKKVFPEFTI
jgi:sulfatase maturation enzyme AslB (radical SAM superfamily)